MIEFPENVSLDEFKQIIKEHANYLVIMFLEEKSIFDKFCFNAHTNLKGIPNQDVTEIFARNTTHLDSMIVAGEELWLGMFGKYQFYDVRETNIFDMFSWGFSPEGREFWERTEIDFHKWYASNWDII